MQGVLMGVLTSKMVRALNPENNELAVRLANWLRDQLCDWDVSFELSLVRAWTTISSRTVRARLSPRLWAEVSGYPEAVREVEEGGHVFCGIELSYFRGYERGVTPIWDNEADVRGVIPGSDWKTLAVGVQICAHPTDRSKILVRLEKR
jgi:hypothetical protein